MGSLCAVTSVKDGVKDGEWVALSVLTRPVAPSDSTLHPSPAQQHSWVLSHSLGLFGYAYPGVEAP